MRITFRLCVGMLVAWALLLAVGAPGARAQSGCPSKNPASDYNCADGPDYLVPGLTDLAGWNHRASYHNILYGDLDNDGADEMVARGSAGMEVYRFDSKLGQWTQVNMTNQIFSNTQGWGPGAPHYYDTIRLGDLDGDGNAELVARGGSGIIVYGFTPGSLADTARWTILDSGGPMADGTCFKDPNYANDQHCWNDDPSYYSTIALTPIGQSLTQPKPTLQLMGRGGDGLELYSWNGANKGWTRLATLTELSDGSASTNRDPDFYGNIISWDANTLFARDYGGMQTYKYTPGTGGGSWQQVNSANPPFDSDDAPFSDTFDTIQAIRGFTFRRVRQPVLMGRLDGPASGLAFYRLANNGWHRFEVKGPGGYRLFLGGAGNWERTRYARSIQAADVDADGDDEILARGSGGMLTYMLAGSPGAWTWKLVSANRPALADDPWLGDAYVSTIKTARLIPHSNVRSLMARGPSGVRTWRFDKPTDRWVRYQRYGTFPVLNPDAEHDVSIALGIDQDIRSIYATPTLSPGADNSQNPTYGKLKTYAATLAGKPWCEGLTFGLNQQDQACPLPANPPAGWKTVSATDWSRAVNQIFNELNYAAEVIDWFGQVYNLQSSVFSYEKAVYGDISKDLGLDQASNVSASVDYLELFEGILDILSAIPGIGEVFGVTGGALGIADSVAIHATGPTKFDTTAAALGDYLTAMQTKALITTGQHQSYVLSDWGLMKTVGRLNLSNVWTLDSDKAQSASRQGFTKWVYQEYLPVLWDHWNVTNCLQSALDVGKDGFCAINGPTMSTYDIAQRGGGNGEAIHFNGLVPHQNACPGYRRCEWASLQNQHYGDVADIVTRQVTPACQQEWLPGSRGPDGKRKLDGCGLGISLSELFGSWRFPSYKCDDYYDGGAGTGCHTAQPTDVVAGDAAGLGTRRGRVNAAIVAPLKRDLDLRRARITVGHLLHEGSAAGELVNRRPGKDLTPVTLRVKRGARRHSARFETARGRRPRIRGTISVVPRRVRVRRKRGRGRRTRLVRTLRVRLRVDRAHLDRPRDCAGERTTHLGVHLLVRPRRGRRHAQVLGMQPWACMKGGRLRYRHPRSVARVRRAKAAVSRHGVASIPLRCSSSGLRRCRGSVVLSARFDGARRVMIGRDGFSISAGHSRAGRYRDANSESLRVRLSARARSALAANGRLTATASVRTVQPSGAVLVSRRLVLVAR